VAKERRSDGLLEVAKGLAENRGVRAKELKSREGQGDILYYGVLRFARTRCIQLEGPHGKEGLACASPRKRLRCGCSHGNKDEDRGLHRNDLLKEVPMKVD